MNSPWRDRPIEESLRLFDEMRRGMIEEGKATLRMKQDMQNDNCNMYDLIAYRIKASETNISLVAEECVLPILWISYFFVCFAVHTSSSCWWQMVHLSELRFCALHCWLSREYNTFGMLGLLAFCSIKCFIGDPLLVTYYLSVSLTICNLLSCSNFFFYLHKMQLCTLEFETRRASYYWLLHSLDLYMPYVWEYSRLNITNTVMSKRKVGKILNLLVNIFEQVTQRIIYWLYRFFFFFLLQLNYIVTNNYVDGWDDPRLLTLAGLRRRGVTPTAINAFVRGMGITRRFAIYLYHKSLIRFGLS